jgi:cell division transport system permease protein
MKIKFLFSEGIKNILRNRYNFILSALVCALCLLLLTIFLVFTINLLKIKAQVEDKFEIYAFLDPTLKNYEEALAKLQALRGVKYVAYISPEEALEELKSELGTYQSVLEGLDYNPLPPLLRIKLDPNYKLTYEHLRELQNKILVIPEIKEVWLGADLLTKLQKIIQIVLGIDFATIVVVFMAVLFIISRTIETTILARSQEIEIMKLIGASDATIKVPFYLQGFFNGLMGGVITVLIVGLFSYILSWQFPMITFAPSIIIPFNLFIGTFSGLGGCYIALNRILRH